MLSRAGFHRGVKLCFTGRGGKWASPSKQGQSKRRRRKPIGQAKTAENFGYLVFLVVAMITIGVFVRIVLFNLR